MSPRRLAAAARRLLRDQAGASAVEFAILGVPFVMLLLFALQIGLYAMTKSALDVGVVRAGEALQADCNSPAPIAYDGPTVKAYVVSGANGLVINNSQLKVDIRQLSTLSSGATPIADQTVDYGLPHAVLVLRASFVTPTFVPGLNAVMTAYSSVMVRRQSL